MLGSGVLLIIERIEDMTVKWSLCPMHCVDGFVHIMYHRIRREVVCVEHSVSGLCMKFAELGDAELGIADRHLDGLHSAAKPVDQLASTVLVNRCMLLQRQRQHMINQGCTAPIISSTRLIKHIVFHNRTPCAACQAAAAAAAAAAAVK
jgi:hypothetical protein